MQNIQREACYCSKTYRIVKGGQILIQNIWMFNLEPDPVQLCTVQYCTVHILRMSLFLRQNAFTVQCMHCLINFTVYVESVTQDVFQNPILLINQLDLVSKSYSFFQICWTYSTVVSKSDYPYKSVGPSFQIRLSL